MLSTPWREEKFSGGYVVGDATGQALVPVDTWSLEIGTAIPPYDRPAKYEKNVVREKNRTEGLCRRG
jgi:hypothetical protein